MRLLSPLLGSLALLTLPLAIGAERSPSGEQDEIMAHANQPWQGDLDGMTERGFLRILTVHNPLFFSFDGSRQNGMVAELGKLYEDHLGEEIGRVRSPTIPRHGQSDDHAGKAKTGRFRPADIPQRRRTGDHRARG
jgi:hypothetical protein